MRILALLVVIGCAGIEAPPPRPVPPAPRCTHTLARESVTTSYFERVAWLDEHTVVGFIDNGGTLRKRDVPENSGIVVYDIRRHDALLFSYRVAASDIAMKRDSRAVMLFNHDGVGTLDLDTGCLRVAKTVPMFILGAPSSGQLVAFDPAGRMFMFVGDVLASVDADTLDEKRGSERIVNPGDRIESISYDGSSDAVVALRGDGAIAIYDASTLALRTTVRIPNAVDVRLGPLSRPGHSEAIFVYDVACKRHLEAQVPMPRNCRDPVEQVHVARLDTRTGAVVEDRVALGAAPQRFLFHNGGWSSDGRRLLLPQLAFVWEIGTAPKIARHLDERYPHVSALDPTGRRFVRHDLDVVDVESGRVVWEAPLPP
jgi:hypothetical protein